MKKLSNRMKILAMFALCSFLFLPAISQADEYVELGTIEFGKGTGTETLYLGANVMSRTATPVLKSLIISVQNGEKRGEKLTNKGKDRVSVMNNKRVTGNGKDRVSSAYVSVNGQEIFVPKHFNQNVVSSLTRTIDVDEPGMSEVVVDVKVNGHEGVHLAVTVTAVYEEVLVPVPWYLDTDVPPNGIGGPIIGMGTINTPPPPDPRGIWVPVGGDIR